MKTGALASLLAFLLLLGATALPAGACPTCRDSVAPSADARQIGPSTGLADGFNASIWVMLGGVGISLGLVGCLVTRVVRSEAAASLLDRSAIVPRDRPHSIPPSRPRP